MAVKKPGLGRGFDALLSSARRSGAVPLNLAALNPAENVGNSDSTDGVEGVNAPIPINGQLRQLSVKQIQPGKYQPRRTIDPDSLTDLANSIRVQGVIQPIVVRPVADQQYELIAGERRWRAAQMAELDTIPAIVREVPDQVAIALALIENIQRESLKPLEEAMALHRLLTEFELSHEQVGQALGRSRSAISNALRLLDLGDYSKTLLDEGRLEMGHTRSLLGLTGALQDEAAHKVFTEGLSVRQTEKLVRDLKAQEAHSVNHQPDLKKARAAVSNPNINQVQDNLSAKLGAKVNIQHSTRGKGKLVIHYNSLDEFDGILAHLLPDFVEKN